MRKNLIILAASMLAEGAVGPPAWATAVDLELLLLVDVSGSVDANEFAIQRDGYEAAFRDLAIISAIQAGSYGKIAATMVYWSGWNQQAQVVGWTEISDSATSNAFANAIAATTQLYSGMTGLGEALVFGTDKFLVGGAGNGFEGSRLVIDISGDGADNDGSVSSLQGRTYALANGVDAINGLVIGGQQAVYDHYNTQVVGGTNYFIMTAATFNDFDVAIKEKLYKEITVVPEPMTMAGLALGVGCLARYVRRRRA